MQNTALSLTLPIVMVVKATALQQIMEPLFLEMGVEVWMKRDDLTHPLISGNKWRKLKYNLIAAREEGQHLLLSFGGIYSNHIHALAAAGKLFGFNTIGIIRGEPADERTDTLRFAEAQGMQLHFLDRSGYRLKHEPDFSEQLRDRFGDFYLVPEGGTNLAALRGCVEMVEEIEIPYDCLCVASGTGGTLAGIVSGLKGKQQITGFSSLKGEDTLTEKVAGLVKEFTRGNLSKWEVCFDYHFGGYAKVNEALIGFIKKFTIEQNIPLEPVYTGKMMFGLYDRIKKGYYPRGSRIIAIHTGGLQGLCGYKKYFG